MVLFSLAGLGTNLREEHRLLQNRYIGKITIGPTSRDLGLFLHMKLILSQNMEMEVETGGQFISC